MTTCKFECTSIRKYKGWGGHQFLHEAEFQAVVGDKGGEENKAFFAATPSGSIKVATVVPDVFVPGQLYYVEFREAE